MSRYIPTRFLDGEAERIVELAAAETGENLSKMVRKLVNEALKARGVVSAPREAVAEAVASVRAEGLEPSDRGHQVLERVAAGEIAFEEAVEQLVEQHTVEVPPPAFQEPVKPQRVRTNKTNSELLAERAAKRLAR